MQSGKVVGTDGFLIDLYKRFTKHIAPLLLDMYDSLVKGPPPLTLTQDSISLISQV